MRSALHSSMQHKCRHNTLNQITTREICVLVGGLASRCSSLSLSSTPRFRHILRYPNAIPNCTASRHIRTSLRHHFGTNAGMLDLPNHKAARLPTMVLGSLIAILGLASSIPDRPVEGLVRCHTSTLRMRVNISIKRDVAVVIVSRPISSRDDALIRAWRRIPQHPWRRFWRG